MFGTSMVVRALADANPDAGLTEDRVRWVIRRGLVPTIRSVAGRLVWTQREVDAVARALGLRAPKLAVGHAQSTIDMPDTVKSEDDNTRH